MREHLFGVDDASDAVQPDPVAQIGIVEGTKIPAGSATPLACDAGVQKPAHNRSL